LMLTEDRQSSGTGGSDMITIEFLEELVCH